MRKYQCCHILGNELWCTANGRHSGVEIMSSEFKLNGSMATWV